MDKILKYIKKILLLVKYSKKNMEIQQGTSSTGKKKLLKKVLGITFCLVYSIFVFYNIIEHSLKTQGEEQIILSSVFIIISAIPFFVAVQTFYLEFMVENNYDRTFPVTKAQRGYAEILKNFKVAIIFLGVALIYYAILIFKVPDTIMLVLRAILVEISLLIPLVLVAMIIPKIILEILKKIIPIKILKKISFVVTTVIMFIVIFAFQNENVSKLITSMDAITQTINIFNDAVTYISVPSLKILNVIGINTVISIILLNIYLFLAILSIKYEDTTIVGGINSLIYNIKNGKNRENNKNISGSNIDEKSIEENKEKNKIKDKEKTRKILEKSIYKLQKSKSKSYYNYDKKFYLRTPIVFFNVVIPIIIVPLIMLGNIYFSMNKSIETAEKYLKETKIEENLTIYDKFQKENWLDDWKHQIDNKDYKNFEKEDFIKTQNEKTKHQIDNYESGKLVKYHASNLIKKGLPEEIKQIFDKERISLIILGIAILSLIFNQVAGISISKDKEDIRQLKTLPISIPKQLKIKGKFAIKLSLAPYFIYLIILFILISNYKMVIEPVILASIILGILYIINTVYEELIIDLLFPNLAWKNPVELVKRNFKIFIMQILFVLKTIMYITIFIKVPFSKSILIAILLVIQIIIFILINLFISKKGTKIYKNI